MYQSTYSSDSCAGSAPQTALAAVTTDWRPTSVVTLALIQSSSVIASHSAARLAFQGASSGTFVAIRSSCVTAAITACCTSGSGGSPAAG